VWGWLGTVSSDPPDAIGSKHIEAPPSGRCEVTQSLKWIVEFGVRRLAVGADRRLRVFLTF